MHYRAIDEVYDQVSEAHDQARITIKEGLAIVIGQTELNINIKIMYLNVEKFFRV